MTGRTIRLQQLFGETGKAVVVACDHGMFDGPQAGMEDLLASLKPLEHAPDGILLAPGMMRHTAAVFGQRGAPLPILRLNFNSVLCFTFGYTGSVSTHLYRPRDAVALGAQAVLVCITLQTGDEATDARNVEIFAELCIEAHQLGLPVVGEYFPHSHLKKEPAAFHEEVAIGCRMLAELGADCIKTFHTVRFAEITRACPVPVLGLGAEKTPTEGAALRLAEQQMKDGAGGVVFGRNVLQARHPARFLAALQDVVKHGKTATAAAADHHLD